MTGTLSTSDAASKNGVKKNLTPKTKGVVENAEFAAFARRIIRAYSRRVAEGDIEALPELADLAVSLNEALTNAVVGLRSFGYSLADIALRLGVSKQAVQQRWGTPATPKGEAWRGIQVIQVSLFDDLLTIGADDEWA